MEPENYTELALRSLERDIQRAACQFPVKNMPWKDVEQEFRWQLYRKFHLYDPEKATLRTWAWMVMRNRWKNLMRAQRDLLDSENRLTDFDIYQREDSVFMHLM